MAGLKDETLVRVLRQQLSRIPETFSPQQFGEMGSRLLARILLLELTGTHKPSSFRKFL